MARGTPSSTTQEHLQRVQALTDAALAHLTLERLLDELLIRVRELLNVDTAAVLLLNDARTELIATAAKGIEEEVEQGVRLPVGRGFAGTIAATGKPVILESVDHTKVLNPLLLRRGIHSMLGVPLVVGGSVMGVLHVGTLYHRLFNEQDIELLQLVADRVALALDALRHKQNRFLTETLQRNLLPERLPHPEGVEISGLYIPAGGGMVGGDWYDVFTLASGSLCVVVGDAVGSGAEAAIVMARLRDAVRTLMFVDGDPAKAMTQLNALMMHFDPGLVATVFMAMIDANGTMTYASAGHMPPIVVDAEGRARVVEEAAEPVLGAMFHTYAARTIDLPLGGSLIVYTDGLLERRGRSLDGGLEALRSAAEHPWSSVEELCARALGKETFESGLSDDVAVVALRFESIDRPQEMDVEIAADPRELLPLRQTLRRWFAHHSVGKQDTADLLLAIGEAVANAVEHAYGPGRGRIRLRMTITDGIVEATIKDEGRWREPRGRDRGRGRTLMAAAMDQALVESVETGTTVRLRKVLNTHDE